MLTKNNFFFLVVVACVCVLTTPLLHAAPTPLKIATGSVTGVYYPAGGAICRLINRSHKLASRCTVEATDGSLYNIQALQKGEASIAIVQSDILYNAAKGTGHYTATGADNNLRALFSLYAEPLTLVTRSNSGITSLADLPGKRIDMANPGSGDRNMMALLLQSMKWQTSDFATVTELKAAERAQALCDEKIDLFPYVAGQPSGAIKEASNNCDIVFVPVTGPEIELLLKQHPELSQMRIGEGLYRGIDQPTETIGVSAVVVTTAALDAESAYQIVKSVFDNFEQFKRLHPAFALLKKEELLVTGISAPLHPGAVRYFKETGLLK